MGPVVQTPSFQGRGHRFVPWEPYAPGCGQSIKKFKKKKKNPQQNISKLTQQDTNGIILHAWDLSEDMGKSFTVIRHHRTEDQGHAIISIDAEVVCAKS